MAYRIRSIVEMTGIPRNTLLAWERRYGVPTPSRTPGGHRVYSEADLDLLRRLKELLDQGHRIGEAVALLRRNAEPERAHATAAPIDQQRRELLDALLAFDRTRADEAYHRAGSHALRRVIDEVLLPLLREVGDGWHRGEVSIAQEHFASAFVREQLITMLNRLESGPPGGPAAVCAGYPGERHEIGLLAVAVKLALRGWRVTYLGADLPIEELADVILTRKAELICQSVFAPRSRPELEAYAGRLLRLVPRDTLVALGGPGVAALADESTDRILFAPRFEDLVDRVDEHRRSR
jgi:MerR family transcriptional regulator, light-induced transcriptional regulator